MVGHSTRRAVVVKTSSDGHGPLRRIEVAGRALHNVQAASNDDLAHFTKGYGPTTVVTFRSMAAELLDYREGVLRVPPPDSTEAVDDYIEALEFMLAR